MFAESNYQVNKIVNLPDTIWGMDFIDNQTIIASLKSGKFVLVDLPSKTVEFLSGSPKVFDDGQGGLMDIKKPTRKNLEKWFY
ncbi:MAG: PQQ-dependent sugar dehydrogenase, partial [Gammaproteobacteria bacterium]